jgi:hypothetical protein
VTPLPQARDTCQNQTNLSPVDGYHDLLFCSAEVEKDESAGLRKVFRTHLVLTNSFLTAMSEIYGDVVV